MARVIITFQDGADGVSADMESDPSLPHTSAGMTAAQKVGAVCFDKALEIIEVMGGQDDGERNA